MSVADPLIGSNLFGFEIEEVIGRGGMGVVYRARDRALERNVALKLIAPEYSGFTGFRGRFLAESRLAASLEHPNVVPIYEAGDQDGHLYLAMRYIEGRDLKRILGDGVPTPARTIVICRQVALALDAAHEQGLVHRDVKPSNILVDPHDRAYLADFGLTRLLSDIGPVPVTGSSLGTIDYVAPEQIRGDSIDGRADVYSLGCVLHECLTGIAPFSDRSEVALLYAHLEQEPPAVPGLERVMARALAKDPDDRYATCAELVEAAAGALGVSRTRRTRWPIITGAVAAAAVAAAVVSGLLLTRNVPEPPSHNAGRLVQIDPDSGHVVRTIPIGADPTGVAVGAGGVWAAAYPSHVLWRFDPSSGVTTTSAAATHAVSLAANNGSAFVVDDDGMRSIRPGQTPPVAKVLLENGHPVLGDPTHVAAGPGGVWGIGGDTLYEVVPLNGYTDQATHTVRIPSIDDDESSRSQLSGLAVGKHEVWVIGDVGDPRLWRIDIPRPGVPRSTTLGFAPAGVALGFGHVWVTGQVTNKVYEIDTATGGIVRAIPVGREPMGVTVGAGSVWVANAIDGTISKVDPRSGRTVTIPVGGSPTDVSVGAGSVWVAADAG